MTCHACEQLITMDLNDAGLPAPESISAQTGEMTIEVEEGQTVATKEAIEAGGKYTVTGIQRYE